MNTITIDSKIYRIAEMYAKLHHVSVETVFEKSVNLFLKKFMVSHEEVSQASKYYISPKVKALETGFRCPKDLSVDYKEELSDALAEKYL